MKVILSELAGFCYGVRRAIDTVLQVSESNEKSIYTLGPLIHNPQVIEMLESKGIKSVKEISEIPANSIIIMPSHGVARTIMENAKKLNLEIIDLTCPFVSKVHRQAENLYNQGYQVVVLGDKGHTELKGIMSVAGENAISVENIDELSQHTISNKVGIVAQTTQTIDDYQKLVYAISGIAHEVRAYNTICHATSDRQKSALKLAESVDIMLVVGGRNSANTRRLTEICIEYGVPTFHVEVSDEIQDEWFAGKSSVGVTAGASTPDWIINQVVDRISAISEV